MSKKTKILFLADDFSQGGAARMVETLIRGLSAEFIPSLFCLDALGWRGKQLREDLAIEVGCLQRRPGVDWRLIRRLAHLIGRRRIDLLHAHQYTAYFYGCSAALLAGRGRVVFSEHGRHYPDVRKTRRVLLNRLLLARTAAVTAVSEAVRDSLVKYEGIPRQRIRILLNGIDPAPFQNPARPELRKQLKLDPAVFLLGMVARLGPEKDHCSLLKALRLLIERGKKVHLLIVGDGPKRQELWELARRLGVVEQVSFTGNRRDIPQLLSALDLVVLSSFYEGTSITLLEAMAAGKAVLASRVGGNPQVVREGESGLLFEQGNVEELAQKIILLSENETLRKRMGRQGRRLLEEQFCSRRMVANYEELYRQVLAPGKRD